MSPQILHCFQFLLGLTMVPRESQKKCLCKIWGDKQGDFLLVSCWLSVQVSPHFVITLLLITWIICVSSKTDADSGRPLLSPFGCFPRHTCAILEKKNGTNSHTDVASTRTMLPNALVQRIVVLNSAKRNLRLPLEESKDFIIPRLN